MNCYEELLEVADKNNLDVLEVPFRHVDGMIQFNTIGIRKTIDTVAQKADILCEELSHAALTVGNILDQSVTENRRQEARARRLAHDIRIGLDGLVDAYRAHCRSRYEIADYLGTTEEFLQEAIDGYRDKYGRFAVCGDCIVIFEPSLAVLEMTSDIRKEITNGTTD